jgi:hypothetical protein
LVLFIHIKRWVLEENSLCSISWLWAIVQWVVLEALLPEVNRWAWDQVEVNGDRCNPVKWGLSLHRWSRACRADRCPVWPRKADRDSFRQVKAGVRGHRRWDRTCKAAGLILKGVAERADPLPGTVRVTAVGIRYL